jgi:NAD(P)H-nitrite reductase large subunit
MNIVIIGSSAAGHTLAVKLREITRECGITILTEDAFPCYDRRKLFGYFCGTVREKELFLCPADGYAKQNITFRKETHVTTVNPDRKRVYFKQDEKSDSIPYDYLAICSGTNVVLPDLPGIRKEGVSTLTTLADVKAAKSVVITGPICFFGAWDSRAQQLASLLVSEKKEVKFYGSAPAEQVPGGVEVIDSEIVEFIGEAGLQAVKLKEGKIIGTSFAVTFGPRVASTDFLENAGIALENGFISIDEKYATNKERIFSCGSVTGKNDSWEEAVKSASVLAEILATKIAP